MLSMQMKSGDYVTIGENVVVQVFKESGPQFRISIKAPREIPIVRGKVLERSGNQRPEGLRDRVTHKSPSDLAHAERQKKKFQERQAERLYRSRQIEKALDEMSGILAGLKGEPSLEKEVVSMQGLLEQISCASEALKLPGDIEKMKKDA